MSDEPVSLSAYRLLNEDEFAMEEVREPAIAILFTESEIRTLERIGEGLLRMKSPDGPMLLAKVLAWRSLRKVTT